MPDETQRIFTNGTVGWSASTNHTVNSTINPYLDDATISELRQNLEAIRNQQIDNQTRTSDGFVYFGPQDVGVWGMAADKHKRKSGNTKNVKQIFAEEIKRIKEGK